MSPPHHRCTSDRDFVPWRFSDAGRQSMRATTSFPPSQNLHGSRHHQDQEKAEAEATKLVAELDRDGPRHPTGPGPSCDITATQAEHGTRDFAPRHDQFLTYFFMSGSCVKPPNTLPCLSTATPSGISSFGSGARMKAVTLPALNLPVGRP